MASGSGRRSRDGLGEYWTERRGPALVRVRLLALPQAVLEEVESEIAAAMEIDHPAIVRVLNVSRKPGGSEIVSQGGVGVPLRKLLTALAETNEKFAVSHATWIALEVLKCLQLGQARMQDGKLAPVVHGRLSPGNIFLTRAGEVRVAGFGLDAAARNLIDLNAPMDRTYGYVAPEQKEGRPRPESDTFTIASIIAEMVLGEPLFACRTLAETFDATLARLPPSLRERRPEVPKALDEAVTWGLEKAADRRPRAEGMVGRLSAFQGVLDVGDRIRGDHAAKLADLIRLRLAKEEVEEGQTDVGALAGEPDLVTETRAAKKKKKARAPGRVRALRVAFAVVVVLLAWAAVAKAKWSSWGPKVRAWLSPEMRERFDHLFPTPGTDAGTVLVQAPPPSPPDARAAKPPAEPQAAPPPVAKASLSVKAPNKGHLTIDGQDQGPPPWKELSIPAGEHRVEWIGPKGHASEQVTLDAGAKRTVALKPRRGH